jgi:hypothetical protein
MLNRWVAIAVALLILAIARVGSAQMPPAGGHWEGAIEVPAQKLDIQVDLAPAADKWEGTITIPAQGLKGFPLSGIVVKDNSVSFAMKSVPGDPVFTATLSADGKTMTGNLAQGGGTVPFALTRSGNANIERPPDSTPITKELEGAWEGALNVQATTLRLIFKLANQPKGPATGIVVSVDQGGVEIPAASVIQNGGHLKLLLPSIAASYEGDLKDGILTGTWTQGPGTLPLVLKRTK